MPLSLMPDLVLDHYSQVTPELLRRRGVTVLLSDLDNTLAPPKTREPSNEVRAWIKTLTDAGIRFAIVSNNKSSTRVEDYCADLGVPYIGRAGKPKPGGFRRAMKLFDAVPTETAMLGDLWTTDMLGAKLCGLQMLAVVPVDGSPDFGHTILYQMHRPWMLAARRRQKKYEQI